MAISYKDYKKKYGKQIQEYQNKYNEERKQVVLPTLNELKNTANTTKKNFETAKSSLNKYNKDAGVITNDKSTYSAPNLFTIRNKQLKDSLSGKAPLLNRENNVNAIKNIENKERENIKRYNETISTNKGKQLFNTVKTTRNEDALAQSNYAVQRGIDSYKDSGTFGRIGKIITAPLRGAASVLRLNNNRTYKDPNTGTTYKLPSYNEGVNTGISQYGGNIANTVNAVGNQIGKVGASAILNSVAPYLGTAMYNVDMFDNSYNSTLREGYTQQQATSYALLSTATEFATGKVLGAAIGKFQKQGDFENFISKSLKGVLKSEKLNKTISSAISEGSEEFVQEFIDVFERNLTLGEDNKVTEETFKNALYSGLVGALSSGASEGIRQTQKNGVQAHIDQIIYDIERTNKTTLSDTNKTIIANDVLEEYLNNDGVINSKQVVDNYMKEKRDKIDALSESASKYFNINDTKAVNMLNVLTKFIEDRNYDIVFDNSIGDNVNGFIINGSTIKINPNTENAIEKIAMHEVTHSISTETMRDLVMDYASKHDDFKEALNSLKKTYKTNDVTDEVLADISGQLFGNQEFINILKNDEPTTFKKIYNSIISIANKLTGNSNEFLFTHDLKNKWENAYRNSSTEPSNNTLFSIKQDNKGNKYVNVDTDQDIFDGISPKEYNKIAKMYITDYLLGNTKLAQNESAIIDNKSAKKYTNPGKKQPNFIEKMKLTPELKNVLEIAEKTTVALPSKDTSKYSSWEYYKFNFKIGNNDFTGIVNIGIDSKGNKHFYEVNNIKKTSGISETSLNRPTGFSGNNIPQSNDNVKLPTTTKYSMQENGKNVLVNSYGREIDISSLSKNQYIENYINNKTSKVYDKNKIAAYLGTSDFIASEDAFSNSKTVLITNKDDIKGQDVQEVDKNLLPNNPIHFETPSKFKSFEVFLAAQLDIKSSELYGDYGIEQYLKKLGYDGIVIGSLDDASIISFKDIPTKYTKSWQEYLDENYKSTGTTTKAEEIKLPTINKVNLPTIKDETSNKREISTYECDAIEKKVNKIIASKRSSTINEATKLGDKYLLFTREEKKSFREKLDKYVGLTKEDLEKVDVVKDIRDIVDRYANKEIIYTSSDIIEVKNEIKKYRINPSETVVKDIPDFNDFRKSNFGKITFSKDGSSVDTVYQELCEEYPQYFDRDIYSEAEMLYRISDFMNLDPKVTETYRLDDKSLMDATYNVIKELQNNIMSEEEIEKMQSDIEEKALVRTREIVQKEYIDEMGITFEDLEHGKDINSIDLSRTDPTRVYEKVFGSKVGQKINDVLMYPLKHNEANKIRELNKIREEVKALDIKPGSEMSAAVQKYAEGSYIDTRGDYQKYDDRTLMSEFPNHEDQKKIKDAAKYFRKMYDEIIDRYNQVMAENAYKPMLKRKNYMKHMIEETDIFSRLGTPLNPQSMSQEVLPTDINGITDEFKPGKKWFSGEMRRRGAKTIYDAVKGFDQYIEGALNVIYHTEDIQRERALAKQVRDTYGQNMLDSMDALIEDGVSIKEVKERVQDIYDNKLSKFAAWQDEQANALAGKKGKMDRWIEEQFGRKVYTVLSTAKKQVGANMTGLNVRSALTNFASVVQGSSKTNKVAFLKGTISTINNIIHKDGLVGKSDFLTSRFGTDRLAKTPWDKISGLGQKLMDGTDNFTANLIWRSKYYENLGKGMSESNAIKKADNFAARVMGDRSVGTTATIFNSKTAGIFTQFQLETNNQWSSLIHDNKMALENGELTVEGLMWQAGQLMALSYMFNNFMSAVTGSDVMIDFVDMFKHIFAPDDDDDKEKSMNERAYESFGSLVDQLPFVSVFTGGRLPIGEAFKGVSTGLKMLTNQKDEYGNNITAKDVGKDMIESAFYWILPTGYGQAKKAYKGLKMYDNELPLPGSYTDSGNLKFNADTGLDSRVQAALFGQYSNKEAQKYIDSGYKTIGKNNIQEMKDLGMTSSEYRKYREGLNNAGKETKAKIDYIYNLDNVSLEQKNIMAESVYERDTEAYTKEKNTIEKLKMFPTELKDYYNIKASITSIKKDEGLSDAEKKNQISKEFLECSLNNEQLAFLYSQYYSTEEKLNNLVTLNIPIKEFIKLNSQDIESNYNTKTGKTINGSKKKKVIEYINSLNLSVPQKAILIKTSYNTFKNYDNQIISYVNKIDVSLPEKKVLLKSIGFSNYNKDVISYINSQNLSQKEKEDKLKSLGFTVRNGVVYP